MRLELAVERFCALGVPASAALSHVIVAGRVIPHSASDGERTSPLTDARNSSMRDCGRSGVVEVSSPGREGRGGGSIQVGSPGTASVCWMRTRGQRSELNGGRLFNKLTARWATPQSGLGDRLTPPYLSREDHGEGCRAE